MSYRIETDESLADGARRAAREQADSALESLAGAEDDAGAAIHDARKRFKKIRAVLRLIRLHIGEEAFDRENVAWRDAGRLLAEAREADVATETVGLIEATFHSVLDDDAFGDFRERLDDRANAVLEDALRPGGPVDEATRALQAARERIGSWPVAELDRDALVSGLEKVYRRGRARLDDAYDEPDDPAAAFHEWRKRVKYLWYHLRLLGPAWPEVLRARAEEQHGLANILGDANDLSDLIALLDDEGETLLPDGDARRALAALCRRQRRCWWNEARPLGRRLYALPSDEMAERFRTLISASELVGAQQG